MKSVRKPVITLICFFSCLLSTFSSTILAAAERLEVRIRSTVLNIRETTSTKSPIVDVLQQGEQITVTTTELADWIKLDDGRGFISIHYVDILSRTPVIESPAEEAQRISQQADDSGTRTEVSKVSDQPTPPAPEPEEQPVPLAISPDAVEQTAEQETPAQSSPETAAAPILQSEPVIESSGQSEQPTTPSAEPPANCNVSAANSEMTISSIATTCRKNLKTLYYEACEVTFSLDFHSSCDQAGEVSVTCSAVAQTTNINQLEELAELQQEATIFLKEKASSRQKLLWMPASSEQQITDIQLRQKTCNLK